jgi:carbon storage regulator
MLILTRKIHETIIIDDNIEVKILGIKGSQVRLGITADKSITVHRREIAEKIKLELELELENESIGNRKEPTAVAKPNITYKKAKC